MKHKYKLEQFHFHWGSSATNGTEHALDGIRFASEVSFRSECEVYRLVNRRPESPTYRQLHLVHWNAELFPSFPEAVKASCGLAVLTVLIKVWTKWFRILSDKSYALVIPKIALMVEFNGDSLLLKWDCIEDNDNGSETARYSPQALVYVKKHK